MTSYDVTRFYSLLCHLPETSGRRSLEAFSAFWDTGYSWSCSTLTLIFRAAQIRHGNIGAQESLESLNIFGWIVSCDALNWKSHVESNRNESIFKLFTNWIDFFTIFRLLTGEERRNWKSQPIKIFEKIFLLFFRKDSLNFIALD